MGSEGDVPTVPVADLVRAVASTAYEELQKLVRWLPLPHQANPLPMTLPFTMAAAHRGPPSLLQ